jgi:hypothetical protein
VERIRMNIALLVAVISGVVSIFGLIVGYLLTKQKDREADWRKMKLDLYKSFIVALSGQLNDLTTIQMAYVEATNALALVAPPGVLNAVSTLNEAFVQRRSGISAETIQTLLRALRRDIHPHHRHTKENLDLPFFLNPAASQINPPVPAESN